MISYERGIIFLTYPPIQAALPSSTEHDEGEKKLNEKEPSAQLTRLYGGKS